MDEQRYSTVFKVFVLHAVNACSIPDIAYIPPWQKSQGRFLRIKQKWAQNDEYFLSNTVWPNKRTKA